MIGSQRVWARALAGVALVAMVGASAPASASASEPAGRRWASSSASHAPLHPLGARRSQHRVLIRANRSAVQAAYVPPSRADLRSFAVPVGDQGNVGSCVAWAIDYGMLGWYSRKSGRPGQPFAPMYGYSQINGGGDNGAIPTDALSVLLNDGNDARAHYSHDDYDWWDTPSQSEHANAAHYRISAYNTLFVGSGQAGARVAIETALATGHPVAIEIPVRPGFDYMGSSASSIDTDYSGSIRGWHEVLALAYDTNGLIIQNSWSTGWGYGGYGKLSWAVVQHDVWEADDMNGFATDAAAPVVYSVAASPAAPSGVTAGAATAPYTIKWTSLGTITRYTASYTVDGGAPVPVTMAAKATSYTLRTVPGSTYTFSVQATDFMNRVSAVTTSAPFGSTLVAASDPSITYTGAWALNGSEESTSSALASASITANTRGVSWVASKATTNGAAKVYVDGTLKATINLYALSPQSSVAVWSMDFGSVGTHTVQIVAVGTALHPTVTLDGFLLR